MLPVKERLTLVDVVQGAKTEKIKLYERTEKERTNKQQPIRKVKLVS